MNFFTIFLKFSIAGLVGTHRNDFFFFIFIGLSQLILAWKVAKMVVFNFLNFFCYFFWIFCYESGRNSSERFFIFLFSLFLGLPQLILASKEATMVFFNFFEFFCYFFLIFYYGSGRNSLERFFLFSLFLSLSQLILAWKDAVMLFF